VDPSVAMLTQAGMGYQPVATGIQANRKVPTEGLPFMQGHMGGLAAMAATPFMMRTMGMVGATPMGIGHDQNVYDRMMSQRFTMMQMQAMQSAAAADRDNYAKTFRGLAAMSGTPFGAEQRRAAQALANSATTLSPMLAEMMPEFLDQMGGTRGSSTVMARRFIDAGRYRLDPVSGRMGMSAESVGAISNRLYGDFYNGNNLQSMKGITAGQVGSLFQELQMRGMVGTAASSERSLAGIRGDDSRADTFRALNDIRRTNPNDFTKAAKATGVDMTKPEGLNAEDIDKLNLDPRVMDKIRSFDAGRIKRSIKGYVDVIAAMRDIFGDMGRTNAPMAELVAGVEALTMGGMSQINPGRMSAMVRQTYNLAKQTGVTMDNVLMIQQHAAQRSAAMGIEPAFAVQATQGGLAFGGAYRAQGHGAHTAWGAMNSDQVQQLDTNLRVQAASSNAANRMAVAARMAESVGGFAADSEAGRYVAAVRSGMNQYVAGDGSVRSLMMTDQGFTKLMAGATTRDGRSANFTQGDVQNMLGQHDTNREYVERYGMANTVRRMQGTDELHPFIGHRMHETLTARFRTNLERQGLSSSEAMRRATEVSGRISQRVTRRMFDMSTEEFSDTKQRNEGIADFLDEELEAEGMTDVLGGLDPKARREFLASTADQFHGAANRALKGSIYRSFGNVNNLHRLTNKATLDGADSQQMRARFTGEMQEALAPLGRGSLLQRAVDALHDARPDDPNGMLGIVAQTLGGVNIADINRTLMPHFQKLNEKRRNVIDLQEKIQKEQDPTQRADMMARLDVVRRELTAQASSLAKTGEQFGLFTADSLTHQDLVKAFNTTGSALTITNDLTGLRGGFGHQVSAENIANFRAKPGELTDSDKFALEVSRRQRDVEALRKTLKGEGKITPEQQAVFDRYYAAAQKDPHLRGLDDLRIKFAAVDMMHADVTNLDPRKTPLQNFDVSKLDDADAMTVIRNRRRNTAYRASDEAIDELQKAFPQATRGEAAELAHMRMRATRLGIDQAEVEKYKDANPGKFIGLQGELEALGDIFAGRAAKQFDVTDEEIEALTRSGIKSPSSEQLQRFRDENKMEGDDATITKEMRRRLVYQGKVNASKERWDSFWGSTQGSAAREMYERSEQDIENVAMKLTATPQMVQRLGMRAIDISKQLNTDQQRLRELALYHANGDVSKLMAHDYTLKTQTPEEHGKLTEKLDTEIKEIESRRRNLLAELASTEGLPGRRFQLGDETAARKAVLDAEVQAGRMTQAQADAILASVPTTAQSLRINEVSRDLGSEARARAILGIHPDSRNLTDTQLARISAVRFGAGNDQETRLLYGAERWDALTAVQREDVSKKMGVGLGSEAAAREFLGITEEQQNTSNEHARRVEAAAVGLRTKAHAEQVIGTIKQRDGESAAAYAKRVAEHEKHIRWTGLGLTNAIVAKEQMGIPEDSLDKWDMEHGTTLRATIKARQEQMGGETEALRMMGKKPGQTLTEAEQEQFKQLTYDINLARQVKPADEDMLLSYEAKNERLAFMAGRHGIQVADLESAGEVFVLSAAQQENLIKASKDFRIADSGINSINAQSANLRSQLKALGDNISGNNGDRIQNVKKMLAANDAKIAELKARRSKAEDLVREDAQQREVSPEDYLNGKGWITTGGLATFKDLQRERDEDAVKVEALAKALHVSPADLAGVTRVSRRLLSEQKAIAQKDNMSPVDLTRSILKEYGFNVGDTPSDFEKNFGSLLEGKAGRGMGQRILESQQDIATVAKRKTGGAAGLKGVDEMAAAYFKAVKSGKEEDMVNFRKTYGMYTEDKNNVVTGQSNADFAQFERSMQFQQQTGLLSFGQGGTGRDGEVKTLAKLYTTAMQGGELRKDEARSNKAELSGSVKLTGDMLDFAGAWAAGRAFSPGGP